MNDREVGGISLIIFDFDGVLADSADIKTEAFEELYLDVSVEAADAMYQHHLANPGVPRMDKIRWVEEHALHRIPTPDEVQARADKFGSLVERKVIASAEIPGARDFLELATGHRTMAIASATPQAELQRIVAARDLTKYFDRIFGSPTSKAQAIREMRSVHRVSDLATVMVGDALSDIRAAHECGVGFIGVLGRDGTHPFEDDVTVIGSLHELESELIRATGPPS